MFGSWKPAPRSVGLKREVFGVRFVKSLPPIVESVPPFHFEGTQLEPLTACPPLGSTVFSLGRQPGVAEQPGPVTKAWMVTILEGREADRFLRNDVLTEFAGPEPTHAQSIVQKRVDRIDSPILLLDSLDQFSVDLCNQVVGIPTVPPCDDEVLFVRRDDDFLGVLEVEVDLWKQRIECRLVTHPDGSLRESAGWAVDPFRPFATGFLDVIGEIDRGFACERRCIGKEDQRRRFDPGFLIDEGEFGGISC